MSAWDELQRLIAIPGELKIITNVHACDGEPGGKACFQFPYPESHAKHWVLHDVVRGELVGDRARVHSAEGDWCEGDPDSLLMHLQRHKRPLEPRTT